MNSQATDVFSTAREWLSTVTRNLVDAPSGNEVRRASALLQALLGLVICDRAVNPSGELRSTVALVRWWLNTQHTSGRLAYSDLDPVLLLLALRELRFHGEVEPSLDDHAGWLASELRRADSVSSASAAVALILGQLGYEVEPVAVTPSLPDLTGEERYALLLAGPDQLRGHCAEIAAVTGFGTRDSAIPEQEREVLAALLPTLLVRSLRDQDLELGAELLRTTGYVGAPADGMIRRSAGFIAAQQRPDGRFGYVGAELARSAGDVVVDEVIDVYLPLTVSCLWSLAEVLVPGYRLFAAPAPAAEFVRLAHSG